MTKELDLHYTGLFDIVPYKEVRYTFYYNDADANGVTLYPPEFAVGVEQDGVFTFLDERTLTNALAHLVRNKGNVPKVGSYAGIDDWKILPNTKVFE